MVDKNFSVVTYKNKTTGKDEPMSVLRYRFSKMKTFSDKDYIEKHGLDKTTFSKVMNRRVTGAKVKDPLGKAGKIITQLKKDGVWFGKLPWEGKDESKTVS